MKTRVYLALTAAGLAHQKLSALGSSFDLDARTFLFGRTLTDIVGPKKNKVFQQHVGCIGSTDTINQV